MLISVISAGITYSSFSGWLFLKLILSIKEKTFHSNNKKRRKNNEREKQKQRAKNCFLPPTFVTSRLASSAAAK